MTIQECLAALTIHFPDDLTSIDIEVNNWSYRGEVQIRWKIYAKGEIHASERSLHDAFLTCLEHKGKLIDKLQEVSATSDDLDGMVL